MAHDIPGDGRRRGPDLSRTRETDYRGSRRREFSGSGERGYPVARDREYPGVPERESSAFHDRGYYERGRHGSRDGDPFRDSDSDAHERSFRGSDRGTRDERGESPPSDWPLESRDTFGAGYPGSGSYDGQSESLRTRPEAPERATAAGRHGGASPARARNRGPKNWQRSDERIRDDVCERLSREYDLDVSDVSVSVQQGTVTLSGSVADRGLKHRIEDIADDSPGVRDVDNRLRVARDEHGTRSGGGFWSELFGFEAGAKARDVMTREVLVIGPQDMVQRAAQIMKDADIGSVPVCDGRRLQGMITDRDIAVRVAATARPSDQTRVSDAMTSEVFWCYEDEDIADALDKMGDRQVRRIPVVDREKSLVGIVSLGDMATQRGGTQVQSALEDISEPSLMRH